MIIDPNRQSTPETSHGYQLLVVCGDEVQTFALPAEGQIIVGRAEGSDIRIDHPSVSRAHARLTLGSKMLIEDLGGANGTFVREPLQMNKSATQPLRRLVGQVADLSVGEQLVFGAVSVVLRALPSGASAAVVQSDIMREIYAEATTIARSNLGVLVTGDTGVGKEVLARSIHLASPRAQQPFIAFNCAALGESTLEGELFGYERGAFTGAVQARAGLFEAADGGSVFLDEIGELPLPLQAKVLRVLEERQVLRIGARSTRSLDLRVIAATNRDLDAAVEAGHFRRDLLYRLNAAVFHIPPLRERPTEIAALTDTFVMAACEQLRRPRLRVSAAVRDRLETHDWPGNVRELRNVIERATVLCDGPELDLDHLPRAWSRTASATASIPQPPAQTELGFAQARVHLKAIEQSQIVAALERCGGNQTRAALLLGVSRRTLVKRLGQFELPRPRKPRA